MFFIIHTDSHINLKYTICVVISALSIYSVKYIKSNE